MNRIVRAAGFAAAAVALVAGATYSDPAGAVETVEATAAGPGEQAPAPSVMSDPGLFAKMWSSVTALVTPKPEAPVAAPIGGTLAELVLAYAGVETSDREQECLANAVYFEARSEPIEGQLAVADVIMNRAASGRYPTDLCAVIKQKAQFSFVRKGRFPRADRGSDAWKTAVAIARIAGQKLADAAVPGNVLWYHASYVSPSWGKRLTRQAQIGLHIFYS
jgi:cell wall hydrolase